MRSLVPLQRVGASLFDFPSERLIATGRLLLTAFALVGVSLEAPRPAEHQALTYTITVAYLAFAMVQAALTWRREPGANELILAHAVDVVAVSTLMALTEVSSSPFFVFFTFILLSGAVRWNWRGALVTTALLIAAFTALTALFALTSDGQGVDVTRTVIRTAYLFVAGAMLAYVGAYRERHRNRVARLVAWPGPERRAGGSPPIGPGLVHAAHILRAERILVVWEQPDEPYRHWTLLDRGRIEQGDERASRFADLVSKNAPRAFAVRAQAPDNQLDGRSGRVRAPALDPDLVRTFGIRDALTAPFDLELCRGRVFALDLASRSADDLLLVELIATRIGVDLEHFLLRRQIEEAAALGERVRLGRDLHDSTLQSLAAANILLKLSSDRAAPAMATQLEETRALLVQEQQRIREFVEVHRPALPRSEGDVILADYVRKRLEDLARQWRCDVQFEASPSDLNIPPALARHIRHFLAEAVSNAVRHGPASRIAIRAVRADGRIRLSIEDNGKGFPGLAGRYESEDVAALNLGPASLRSRVHDLDGTLAIETSPSGAHLIVEFPA